MTLVVWVVAYAVGVLTILMLGAWGVYGAERLGLFKGRVEVEEWPVPPGLTQRDVDLTRMEAAMEMGLPIPDGLSSRYPTLKYYFEHGDMALLKSALEKKPLGEGSDPSSFALRPRIYHTPAVVTTSTRVLNERKDTQPEDWRQHTAGCTCFLCRDAVWRKTEYQVARNLHLSGDLTREEIGELYEESFGRDRPMPYPGFRFPKPFEV